MYNSDSSDEKSFADAYKSEILNRGEDSDISSKNLIIILSLIALILALAIFGYIYISSQPPTQSADVERVEKKSKPEETEKSNMLNNIDELMLGEGKIDKVDEVKDDKDEVKIKNIDKKSDTYLEQLADLSKEIDSDKKKK